MTDFIIVGQGLAANVLMHSFHRNSISFITVGNTELSSCSKVAAGIWNPVVFKRMTRSWMANELIPVLNEFYAECESVLGSKLITERPIIKPFIEEQEKRLWTKKSDAELNGFLDPDIYAEKSEALSHLNVPNGYGRVIRSGNLDVAGFIKSSADFFGEKIITEIFDYNQLAVLGNKVVYKEQEAKHIVFCEGYCVKDNPFFNWIPLKPAKGEILEIDAPVLKLKNSVFNKNGFLMDMTGGTYKVGATYEWQELDEKVTDAGRTELLEKLDHMLDATYSVLNHEAGIRPSSIDRRPIIGAHPIYANLHVFNGLGTKGVMLAPFFAKNFVNFYLQTEVINPEVNVSRFYKLYAG